MLRSGVRTTGDAVQQAMQALGSQAGTEDVLRGFVLLGDPATRLALPEVPIASVSGPAEPGLQQPVSLDGGQSQAPGGGSLDWSWSILEEPAPGAGYRASGF